jgi:hypothetical protein
MALAARRLEQLHEALKKEPPKEKSGPKKDQPPPGGSGTGGTAEPSDLIPPLAQLKVLKALQAELNQRTEEFAKEHPDKSKLSEEGTAELKELEEAQRDIASLFEQMAKLFEKQKQEMPEKQEKKEPEKSP